MTKLLVLLLSIPSALASQSLISFPRDQCRWHPGDNPAWSQPFLNDSDWLPMANWSIQGDEPRYWVRCKADLRGVSQVREPSIHVEVASAFELFVNGARIGTNGNMSTGNFVLNNDASFSLPPADRMQSWASLIAVRLTCRDFDHYPVPLVITVGELNSIQNRLDSTALAQGKALLPNAILFGVIAVLGFVLLGLFLNDRSRSEFLFLALVCWLLATLRVDELFIAARVQMSSKTEGFLYGIGQMAIVALAFFYSRLARRRMPWIIRISVVLALQRPLLFFAILFLSAGHALRLSEFYSLANPYLLLPYCCIALYPFFAFWPWSRLNHRTRPLAVFGMLWGCIDFIWFMCVILSYTGPAASAFYEHWNGLLLQMRAVTTFAAITTLLVLLFREQREIGEERALLAGEMHAAHRIQRMLAPATIDTVPGLAIEVAFRPVLEVGGDFYLSRILPGGKQRILVGDVSGKGAAAAMTAAMLIGAAQMRDSDSPASLLAHLNAVLCSAKLGGFATCLCIDIDQENDSCLASAGHPAPYQNNEEIQVEPALPLGISVDVDYSNLWLGLALWDRVTLVSDGVLEAQNAAGDLFGFDRAKEISTQSPETIADAAQMFGQQDDITVLSIRRLTIASNGSL